MSDFFNVSESRVVCNYGKRRRGVERNQLVCTIGAVGARPIVLPTMVTKEMEGNC